MRAFLSHSIPASNKLRSLAFEEGDDLVAVVSTALLPLIKR